MAEIRRLNIRRLVYQPVGCSFAVNQLLSSISACRAVNHCSRGWYTDSKPILAMCVHKMRWSSKNIKWFEKFAHFVGQSSLLQANLESPFYQGDLLPSDLGPR